MPIYEYVCKRCKHKFEFLQAFNETGLRIVCPKCVSADVRRVFSTFSKASGGRSCRPTSFG